MEKSSQHDAARKWRLYMGHMQCRQRQISFPLPRCSMLARNVTNWRCVIYVVRVPSRCRWRRSRNIERGGLGGPVRKVVHDDAYMSLLRTFFHQQSPKPWSCIRLWREGATDMCADKIATQDSECIDHVTAVCMRFVHALSSCSRTLEKLLPINTNAHALVR